MKRKYFLIIILIIPVILSGYFIITISQNNQLKKHNKELFDAPPSIINSDFFEYDQTYVLFSNTSDMNAQTFESISYIAKMNEDKIEEVYILKHPYKVISYNQQEEKLILYGNYDTLYINEETVEAVDEISSEIINNTEITLYYQNMANIRVSSLVMAQYATVGYSHTINMSGLSTIIPIGISRTDTIVRYPQE